jgi:hypothetical protein
MMREAVNDEIQKAKQHLGLDDSAIRLLADEECRTVLNEVVSHFVESGDRRWWWEDFCLPSTSVRFANQQGFLYLEKLVPDKREKCWLIVEEDGLPFYPVYEATPEASQAVIGECYAFEYYLVAKDLSWLICETHHNVLIAIGEGLEERLRQIDS